MKDREHYEKLIDSTDHQSIQATCLGELDGLQRLGGSLVQSALSLGEEFVQLWSSVYYFQVPELLCE